MTTATSDRCVVSSFVLSVCACVCVCVFGCSSLVVGCDDCL